MIVVYVKNNFSQNGIKFFRFIGTSLSYKNSCQNRIILTIIFLPIMAIKATFKFEKPNFSILFAKKIHKWKDKNEYKTDQKRV